MSLSDPTYFGFLLLVFLLFYALKPGGPRRSLLLAASYFFYFELSHFFIAVLLFLTVVTYYGSLLLRPPLDDKKGFLRFILIVAVVLAPLVLFKYLGSVLGAFPFFASPLLSDHLAAWALPVGISFFTFAALGYLIDVYLEVLEPETRIERVALFLAFFPVVSAGPIERGGRFLPQLELDLPFTAERGFSALRLIFLGLILKVVLADLLSTPVNLIYAAPATYSPLEQLGAVFLYSFYIYADFAGYSLIAIGSAKLLGLEVRPNFQQPFLSATVPEFWRNWHISLSSWVRDYLFSPLRMEWRRSPSLGMAAALFISFLILGIWHGAKWGYLAFGAMHGLFVVASTFTLSRRNQLWTSLHVPPLLVHVARVLITFVLVSLAFVVYRADTMHQAFGIYRAIFSTQLIQNFGSMLSGLLHLSVHQFRAEQEMVKVAWVVLLIIAGDLLARRKIGLEKFPVILQLILYNYGLLWIVSQWLSHHGTQPFVYYKF